MFLPPSAPPLLNLLLQCRSRSLTCGKSQGTRSTSPRRVRYASSASSSASELKTHHWRFAHFSPEALIIDGWWTCHIFCSFLLSAFYPSPTCSLWYSLKACSCFWWRSIHCHWWSLSDFIGKLITLSFYRKTDRLQVFAAFRRFQAQNSMSTWMSEHLATWRINLAVAVLLAHKKKHLLRNVYLWQSRSWWALIQDWVSIYFALTSFVLVPGLWPLAIICVLYAVSIHRQLNFVRHSRYTDMLGCSSVRSCQPVEIATLWMFSYSLWQRGKQTSDCLELKCWFVLQPSAACMPPQKSIQR